MTNVKLFPIMIGHEGTKGPCPSAIPWDAIAPYEGQAKENHQQSLERLAQRGGLDPIEAFFVMKGRTWLGVKVTDDLEREACAFLDKIVRDREELQAKLDAALLQLNEAREIIRGLYDATENCLGCHRNHEVSARAISFLQSQEEAVRFTQNTSPLLGEEMDKDDKLVGVAWKFEKPPTLDDYKAFMSKEPKLAMIFDDGHREELPLEVIPHCPFPDDAFYVFPFLIRSGDIKGWEAPKEVGTLRLSVQGKGFYWLGREAFSVPKHESTKR